MLTVAIAFSLHLNVSGMNAVHPALWLEHGGWKAGAYLNSYEEISLFAGHRFGNEVWAEVGLVTGYDYKYPVGGRVGFDFNDNTSLWLIPAPETLVLGIEFRL